MSARNQKSKGADPLLRTIAGIDSISGLFAFAFVRAATGLAGSDVAFLLKAPVGNLRTLGWYANPFIKALEDFFADLALRDEHKRFRLRDEDRRRLRVLLGPTPEQPRTWFAVAALLDAGFREYEVELDRHHPTVVGVPAPFLGDINNPPPPIGQMTPLAACRRWMQHFWFIGDLHKLNAFGAVPRLARAKLSPTLNQSLQGALDEDELRIGLVSFRRHSVDDLVLVQRPDTFAVTGLRYAPPAGLIQRIVDALTRDKAHIAIFPELALSDVEERELTSVLRTRDRRYPALTIAGLAHRRRDDDTFTNEAVAFDRKGAEVLRHEKLEPFLYSRHESGALLEDILPRESDAYSFLDTPVGRLAINVCRDVRSDLPMLLNRALGVSLLAVPAYSPQLDFAKEEARVLGARQGCSTFAVNPPGIPPGSPAGFVYVPIRSRNSIAELDPDTGEASALVQVFRVGRSGREGSWSANAGRFL